MKKNTGATGAIVQRSVLVHVPPESAFEAFADVQRLRVWYFDDTTSEFRVGGELTFRGPEGSISATYAEITPSRIVVDYHPPWWGRVTWSLSPERGGTRVALRHEGFEGREDWLDRFSWGWEGFLKSLKAHLEGRPVK